MTEARLEELEEKLSKFQNCMENMREEQMQSQVTIRELKEENAKLKQRVRVAEESNSDSHAKKKIIKKIASENDESSTSEEEISSKKKKKSKKSVTVGTVLQDIPKIDAYCMGEGRSWNKFIKSFEGRCQMKYPDFLDCWTTELGKCLKGEIKKIYTNQGEDCDYETMKKRLNKWIEQSEEAELFHRDHGKFMMATISSNENSAQFANRLESLYIKEYKIHDTEEAHALIQKLMTALPTDVFDQLTSQMRMRKQHFGDSMKWSDIVRFLMTLNNKEFEMSRPTYNTVLANENHVPMNQVDIMTPSNSFLVSCRACNGTGIFDKRKTAMNRQIKDSYSYNNQTRGNNQCNFCKRRGHSMSQCRRKLNLCLLCGSNSHVMRECSKFRPRNQNEPRQNQNEPRRCYTCNETDHVARNCTKRFQQESQQSQVQGNQI